MPSSTAHTLRNTFTFRSTLTHTHTHTHTYTRTHTIQTRPHTNIHAYTHTHTHTDLDTHLINVNTHTHTSALTTLLHIQKANKVTVKDPDLWLSPLPWSTKEPAADDKHMRSRGYEVVHTSVRNCQTFQQLKGEGHSF